jgi:hypothetical protein
MMSIDSAACMRAAISSTRGDVKVRNPPQVPVRAGVANTGIFTPQPRARRGRRCARTSNFSFRILSRFTRNAVKPTTIANVVLRYGQYEPTNPSTALTWPLSPERLRPRMLEEGRVVHSVHYNEIRFNGDDGQGAVVDASLNGTRISGSRCPCQQQANDEFMCEHHHYLLTLLPFQLSDCRHGPSLDLGDGLHSRHPQLLWGPLPGCPFARKVSCDLRRGQSSPWSPIDLGEGCGGRDGQPGAFHARSGGLHRPQRRAGQEARRFFEHDATGELLCIRYFLREDRDVESGHVPMLDVPAGLAMADQEELHDRSTPRLQYSRSLSCRRWVTN